MRDGRRRRELHEEQRPVDEDHRGERCAQLALVELRGLDERGVQSSDINRRKPTNAVAIASRP